MSRPQTLLATVLRRTSVIVTTLMLIVFSLAPYVFADDAGSDPASSASTCSPVATPPSGLQSPTGADSVTYTYNSCTGLWENPYYTWNPLTKITTPKAPFVYNCNISTWQWQYKQWQYSPSRGKFYQATIMVGQLPANALIAADSVAPCLPAAVSNTGPDSTNALEGGTSNAANIDNTNTASISNNITSQSSTGDATVSRNTLAGNATTGNASAMATIINALQSTSSLTGSPVATFTANINGDVQGDLIIDPGQLQPTSDPGSLGSNDLTVNNQTNGQITNDINLSAATGNAAVTHNTTAGDATSGNATAIANVVNMLNSVVAAGQSFVGVININGNLHGNILMPQSFLDSLIASNAPSTTMSLDPNAASSLGITNTNNLSTTNNISANATSGAATVDHNTAAGSATTGNASTQVRIFNLTGSQVVGANCLLVFVNVSGTWVGVIMNAPSGATAAALGSGLSKNMLSGDITNQTNDSITNNINLAAQSGDATVANNTTAGNARSGNAQAAVNLLNMNGSQFNLTGWFGILFINIFGNWYGNFSVYTPPSPASSESNTDTPLSNQTSTPPKVFHFVARPTTITDEGTPLPTIGTELVSTTSKVLGSGITALNKPAVKPAAATYSVQIIGGILVAIGVLTLAGERLVSRRGAKAI